MEEQSNNSLTKNQIWGRNNKAKRKPLCLVCGSEVKKHYRKLCSVSCSNRWKYRDKKNHPNWDGGKTKEYRKLRNSMWKELDLWRKAVLERDSWKCIECGETKELQADHIKPFIDYPELRTSITNGRTLCKNCHYKTETYGTKIKVFRRGKEYLHELVK